jgi:hypothetical protein
MRCNWDEEDVGFYFEVDAEGWVTRQIELQGPELTPITAASLDERQRPSSGPVALSTSSWAWGLGAPRVPDTQRRPPPLCLGVGHQTDTSRCDAVESVGREGRGLRQFCPGSERIPAW